MAHGAAVPPLQRGLAVLLGMSLALVLLYGRWTLARVGGGGSGEDGGGADPDDEEVTVVLGQRAPVKAACAARNGTQLLLRNGTRLLIVKSVGGVGTTTFMEDMAAVVAPVGLCMNKDNDGDRLKHTDVNVTMARLCSDQAERARGCPQQLKFKNKLKKERKRRKGKEKRRERERERKN